MNSSMTTLVVTVNTYTSAWFLANKTVLLESLSQYRTLNLRGVCAWYKRHFGNPLNADQVDPRARLQLSHYAFQVVAKLASHVIALFRRVHNVRAPLTFPATKFGLK